MLGTMTLGTTLGTKLANKRKTLRSTQWMGTGAVMLSMVLVGCGGHKSSKSSSGSTTVAPATSGTTGGATSGTIGGATSGTIGGATSGTIGGGVTNPGISPGAILPGAPGTPGNPGGVPLPGAPGSGTGTPGTGTPGTGTPTVPGDDHGNDASSATSVGLSAATAGRIDYAADADWFKVSLVNGVGYDFMTQTLGGGMDTILRLMDTNGTTMIAENDDVQAGMMESRLSFTAPANGDYWLAVVHKDAAATSGTYEVLVAVGGSVAPPAPVDDHGDDQASATAVTVGPATAGKIEVGTDVDMFAVDLTAGSVYDFRTATNDDTILTLFDDQGGLLDSNDDEDVQAGLLNSLISGYTAPATGTYYLLVESYQSTLADYTIIVSGGTAPTPDDHGDDQASATAITVNQGTSGKIEVGTDIDMFAIDVTAGTVYDFKTDTFDDTILTLFDDQGNLIDSNDDEDPLAGLYNSLISQWTAPNTGTYYLMVESYQNTLADYTITASAPTTPTPPTTVPDDHGNDMASATAIVLSSTATAGKIEVAGDEDWFEVDLTDGKSYEFRAATTGDTTLALMDGQGNQLGFNDDDTAGMTLGSVIAYVATGSGSHYLVVKGKGQTTPDYDVSAVDNTPPAADAQLATAAFSDKDGNQLASLGDEILLTFSEDVTTVTPIMALDPNQELALAVTGNTFGMGATMSTTANAKEILVVLGADPNLRLGGTFDVAQVTSGSASGLDVAAGTSIQTAATQTAAVSNAVDIETSLTTGFYPAADLVTARGYHSATTLDDGRVLVVGGLIDNASFAYQAEIYDPATGTWTEAMDQSLGGNAAIMAGQDGVTGRAYYIGRYDHTATKLPNGQVLVAGGYGFEGTFDHVTDPQNPAPVYRELQSAFVFDPSTNAFTPAGLVQAPRRGHYATLMPNGNVVLTGGFNSDVNGGLGGTLPLAEVYDAAAGTFTALQTVAMQFPREAGTAHLLPSGKILHVGGHFYTPNQAGTDLELIAAPGTAEFDMTAGGVAGPGLGEDRRWHASSENAAGEVFLFGGDAGAGLTSVEKLDPVAMTFTKVGDLRAPRARAQAVTIGENVLVIGGINIDYTAGSITNLTTGELYNTAANVSEEYQLQSERNTFQAVKLNDGSVMLIGGYAGGSTSISGLDGTAVLACERFVQP